MATISKAWSIGNIPLVEITDRNDDSGELVDSILQALVSGATLSLTKDWVLTTTYRAHLTVRSMKPALLRLTAERSDIF